MFLRTLLQRRRAASGSTTTSWKPSTSPGRRRFEGRAAGLPGACSTLDRQPKFAAESGDDPGSAGLAASAPSASPSPCCRRSAARLLSRRPDTELAQFCYAALIAGLRPPSSPGPARSAACTLAWRWRPRSPGRCCSAVPGRCCWLHAARRRCELAEVVWTDALAAPLHPGQASAGIGAAQGLDPCADAATSRRRW